MHLVFFEDVGRCIDVGRGNLQHLRSGINNETDHLSIEFSDEDSIFFVRDDLTLSKALSQINDRDDLAAQIDHAFHVVRCIGDGCDFRDANDLVNEIDRDTECLPADAEAHEMEVFGHQTDPLNLVAGGCGHGITSITPISTITATSLLTIQAMRSERLKNEAIHRFEQSAGHLRHLIGRSGQLG